MFLRKMLFCIQRFAKKYIIKTQMQKWNRKCAFQFAMVFIRDEIQDTRVGVGQDVLFWKFLYRLIGLFIVEKESG